MEMFDVVIVGSGYGGSVSAARLAEAGMSVLVLERGPRRSAADFRQSDDPRYIQSIYELFVTSSNIGYRTGTMVGGASIPMDGAHFRMPQRSFEVTDGTGRPYWPGGYSRAALDPYYDRAEAMLQIRQFGWDEISKCAGMFGQMLDLAGASCERARMNYTNCLHCGFCSQGCIFDKKQSLILNYIPAAEAAGAEFRPDCMVDHVEPMGAQWAVHYVRDGAMQVACGQRLIVACGGIHTPALLLRSASYLPDLSPQVGANFNNNGEHGYIGILPPEFAGVDGHSCFKGMENGGLMTYHWFESDGITMHPGAGLEPSVLTAAIEAADHPLLPSRSWGMDFKRFVEEIYPSRIIAFSVLGLADGHRRIVTRADGSPDMQELDRTEYDAYLDRSDVIMEEISRASGVTLVPAVPRDQAGQTSAHLLSACRMGQDAASGVVDADCRVFNYPTMYICDASAVPFALGVNPALTISALAERTAERILAE